MAQVIVNPKELRAFAKNLAELSGEFRAREQRLNNELQMLGKTWADEKYRRFTTSHELMSLQLQFFYRMSARYVQFLGTKATAAEKYLGH